MARVVNEAAHAARRNAILDAAQRAIATKGYEQMAIADLLGELGISSGAFYHYFDSKPALLAALVERMGSAVEAQILPIVHDRELGAIEKFQRFFATADRWKLAHRDLLLAYTRIWYADDNAIVRHKLHSTRIKRLTPWLEEMILQGSREGVFQIAYPDQAARLIISMLEDFGYAFAELFLSEECSQDDLPRLERIAVATSDAMERVLGAPANSLWLATRDDLAQWLPPYSRLVGTSTMNREASVSEGD
ncbi:TetR family transcriptional regulator [Ktedonobacter sp. SOSP1-85]|uniref:TetR/AcrR family transcriptional regulator n=1 Tax=Ktedonobacter sp. SOSP1-85 TaxID=2778367 RepID=UPI001A183588|nr:TetR/AcrR family transcriptional regulator [Ktedonobacter sp. SOSP1-85]GHO72934.1 TetR family transcriptional regulator [Ktedonobacter sp. SOSP1-85]